VPSNPVTINILSFKIPVLRSRIILMQQRGGGENDAALSVPLNSPWFILGQKNSAPVLHFDAVPAPTTGK
jgi:hypothetical protein